eukprot:gene13980-18750_t
MIEESNLKIREVFSILSQGVEMVQYSLNNRDKKYSKGNRSTKIVWMDSDIYRICVDTNRLSLADRSKGIIPNGLYLRDISEVREGSDSFDFSKIPPKDSDCCLILVGSESSISLELPSKFTRDWFLVRLRLLVKDILVEREQIIRKYKILDNCRSLSIQDIPYVHNITSVLERGVQVLHHQRIGKIEKSILSYESSCNSLTLQPLQKSWGSSSTVLKLRIADIAEIRPGSHSLGFVKTNSTNLDSETIAIVGTENVFELQFINEDTRDIFADRLFLFLLYYGEKAYASVNASMARGSLHNDNNIPTYGK